MNNLPGHFTSRQAHASFLNCKQVARRLLEQRGVEVAEEEGLGVSDLIGQGVPPHVAQRVGAAAFAAAAQQIRNEQETDHAGAANFDSPLTAGLRGRPSPPAAARLDCIGDSTGAKRGGG